MKYSYRSNGFVLGASLMCLALISGLASAAGPACPQECKAWSEIEIPQGDELLIKHNGDIEAIAVRLGGSVIADLAFKNTSPSVQLYASCQTGVGSLNKIDGLSGAEFAACRFYYKDVADSLGIPVVLE
jgi:hypothetical protein